MTRTGQIAATLFFALGVGGILTLFSQVGAEREPRSEVRSLNVSSPESEIIRRVVPAAIEGGAAGTRHDGGPEDEKREREPGSTRLILR